MQGICFCEVYAEDGHVFWGQAIFQHFLDEVGSDGLEFLAVLVDKALGLVAVYVIDVGFFPYRYQTTDELGYLGGVAAVAVEHQSAVGVLVYLFGGLFLHNCLITVIEGVEYATVHFHEEGEVF